MMLSIAIFVAFVGVTNASLASNHAFTPRKALSIRGGAGPLDPDLAAKGAIGIGVVQGTTNVVAPAKWLDMVHVPSTPTTNHLTRRAGTGFLNYALVAYCMLERKTSLATATGYGAVLWVAEFLRTILTKEPESIGMAAGGQYILLILYSIISWATLGSNNSELADRAVKLHAAWCGFNGLFMIFKPSVLLEQWGFAARDAPECFLMRIVGYHILAGAVLVGCLVCDIPIIKSIGYGSLVFLACVLDMNFLNKDATKFEMTMGFQYFWLAFLTVVTATMLL